MHVVLSNLAIQLFVVLTKHLSLLLCSTNCDLQTDLSVLLVSILSTGMLRCRHTPLEQVIRACSDQSRRGQSQAHQQKLGLELPFEYARVHSNHSCNQCHGKQYQACQYACWPSTSLLQSYKQGSCSTRILGSRWSIECIWLHLQGRCQHWASDSRMLQQC